MNFKETTLENLANGALPQLFQKALGEVLENIHDQNTAPDKTRKITLEIEIKPTKSRDSAAIQVKSRTSLASVIPVDWTLHLGKEGGKYKAFNYDATQQEFFEENITSIN